MSFREIFCQDKAVAVLQRAFVADKVPHAYIFAGAEGIGKFKTARQWAKLLLCEQPVSEGQLTDSCGVCQSCELFDAGSHPDFYHVYKELLEYTKQGKGKTTPIDISIDVIREFLIEKVSTRPTLSQRKVFIVSEAEKLNAHSQNALLKVLEEPPAYCCIILLCTRLERLLPTTKSRCRIVRFGPIDRQIIVEKLREIGLEQQQAQYFARLSEGSLGTACQLAELQLHDANLYEIKKKLVQSVANLELADVIELAEQILEGSRKIAAVWSKLDETTSKTDINRRTQKILIRIIISALYDAMKSNVPPARTVSGVVESPVETVLNFDQTEQIKRLSGRFDPELAAEKIDQCYKSLYRIEASANEKLIFEQLLLNLTGSDIISTGE